MIVRIIYGVKVLEHALKVVEMIFEHRICQQIDIDDMQFGFMKGYGTTDAILGHFLRDDLINPVKMSIHPYVRTSTMKHNAATNQILVFIMVDETFTTI